VEPLGSPTVSLGISSCYGVFQRATTNSELLATPGMFFTISSFDTTEKYYDH